MRLRKLLGKTVDVVEIAVRLVLVLFLQLSIVETLIVEFGQLRCRGLRARDSNIMLSLVDWLLNAE